MQRNYKFECVGVSGKDGKPAVCEGTLEVELSDVPSEAEKVLECFENGLAGPMWEGMLEMGTNHGGYGIFNRVTTDPLTGRKTRTPAGKFIINKGEPNDSYRIIVTKVINV